MKIEKQKRKRGKRLNLLGEIAGGPEFFSPSRVLKAKAFQEAKVAKEQEKKMLLQTVKLRQMRHISKKMLTRQNMLYNELLVSQKLMQLRLRKLLKLLPTN